MIILERDDNFESIGGEAESCVADSMYKSSELIQERCDSESWCSYILCVCIFECYAHECFTLSIVQFLLCYV
jgi:hypothetical protein